MSLGGRAQEGQKKRFHALYNKACAFLIIGRFMRRVAVCAVPFCSVLTVGFSLSGCASGHAPRSDDANEADDQASVSAADLGESQDDASEKSFDDVREDRHAKKRRAKDLKDKQHPKAVPIKVTEPRQVTILSVAPAITPDGAEGHQAGENVSIVWQERASDDPVFIVQPGVVCTFTLGNALIVPAKKGGYQVQPNSLCTNAAPSNPIEMP